MGFTCVSLLLPVCALLVCSVLFPFAILSYNKITLLPWSPASGSSLQPHLLTDLCQSIKQAMLCMKVSKFWRTFQSLQLASLEKKSRLCDVCYVHATQVLIKSFHAVFSRFIYIYIPWSLHEKTENLFSVSNWKYLDMLIYSVSKFVYGHNVATVFFSQFYSVKDLIRNNLAVLMVLRMTMKE